MKPTLARLACLTFALCAIAVWATPVYTQETAAKPAIKHSVAPPTPADSGPAMYQAYCAACHGVRGAGDGPAAPALKVPPTDLRVLAKQNNGAFPSQHVAEVLKNGVAHAAHGSSEMPIWGPTFRALADPQIAQLRIANLSDFLKSMQLK